MRFLFFFILTSSFLFSQNNNQFSDPYKNSKLEKKNFYVSQKKDEKRPDKIDLKNPMVIDKKTNKSRNKKSQKVNKTTKDLNLKSKKTELKRDDEQRKKREDYLEKKLIEDYLEKKSSIDVHSDQPGLYEAEPKSVTKWDGNKRSDSKKDIDKKDTGFEFKKIFKKSRLLFQSEKSRKKGTALLGAESQFSGTSWAESMISPKVGYFILDDLAIGAMFHFGSDNQYVPAFAGNYEIVNGQPTVVGAHGDYTLTEDKRVFGFFAKYYLNNLFFETSLGRTVSHVDSWVPVTYFNVGQNQWITEDMVTQTKMSTSNLGLGMGYAFFFGKFSIEPFVRFDIIVDGEMVMEDNGTIQTVETVDLSGSEFVGGLSLNLFF